jgi:hypothetical protein
VKEKIHTTHTINLLAIQIRASKITMGVITMVVTAAEPLFMTTTNKIKCNQLLTLNVIPSFHQVQLLQTTAISEERICRMQTISGHRTAMDSHSNSSSNSINKMWSSSSHRSVRAWACDLISTILIRNCSPTALVSTWEEV